MTTAHNYSASATDRPAFSKANLGLAQGLSQPQSSRVESSTERPAALGETEEAMRKLANPNQGLLELGLAKSMDELIDDNSLSGAGKTIKNLKTFFSGVTDSSSGIFTQLTNLTSIGLKKAFSGRSKPLTWGILIGGVLAGLSALKDLINASKNWTSKERFDLGKPAFLQTINAVLKGGLSVGLLAPFMKWKNPFARNVHGKEEVKVKLIVGAALATFLIDLTMSIASGTSRLNKIPIFGGLLEGIFKPIYGGIDYISRTENTPQNAAGQPAANPLAALGGLT
jgi:hypothetical protein